MKNENDHAAERSLLSDEDFEALIDAEYQQQSGQSDEVEKQKTWNALENSIQQKEHALTGGTTGSGKVNKTAQGENRHNNQSDNKAVASLALAAIIMIVAIPLAKLSGPLNPERIKGAEDKTALTLKAFTLGKKGALQPSTGKHAIGSTVVFETDTTKTQYSALLLSRNNNSPEVRFMSEIKENSRPALLKSRNRVYGYMMEPNDKSLRFCLLYATKKPLLRKQIRSIDRLWRGLSHTSCVSLVVPD